MCANISPDPQKGKGETRWILHPGRGMKSKPTGDVLHATGHRLFEGLSLQIIYKNSYYSSNRYDSEEEDHAGNL
jgi:hypothetical protein